jgi:hypothetical protein
MPGASTGPTTTNATTSGNGHLRVMNKYLTNFRDDASGDDVSTTSPEDSIPGCIFDTISHLSLLFGHQLRGNLPLGATPPRTPVIRTVPGAEC